MNRESVLHQIADGDPTAMSTVLDRYSGLVWSLARKFSPNLHDAEDAVQEIFLELWRSASRFDPAIAGEATFVAMIARRRLIDRNRRRAAQPTTTAMAEGDPYAAESEPDRAEIADETRMVTAAFGTLRPEQKRVLELALVHGHTHTQISEQTGMPLGTVKSLARRGLMKVREALGLDPRPEAQRGTAQ